MTVWLYTGVRRGSIPARGWRLHNERLGGVLEYIVRRGSIPARGWRHKEKEDVEREECMSEEGRSPQGVGDKPEVEHRLGRYKRPKRVDPRKGLETRKHPALP